MMGIYLTVRRAHAEVGRSFLRGSPAYGTAQGVSLPALQHAGGNTRWP
jgi:hypothetical protein